MKFNATIILWVLVVCFLSISSFSTFSSQMLNHVHHVRDSLKRRIFIGEQIQNTLRTGAINLSQTLWELTVAYWL